MKEIGKGEEGGGGIEGGGREKSSNCTLSFKGAKNFIPGKALFFLSLENSVSTPLIAAAVHTHGYFHTAVCEDRRGILRSPARPHTPPPSSPRPSLLHSIPPHPARCCPWWASQFDSKRSLPWSRLEQTKSAAQGWPGSSLRGSSLARNAWQWTRPNTHRLFLHSTPVFLSLPPSLFIYHASCSRLISTWFILPSLPPSNHSCPTV